MRKVAAVCGKPGGTAGNVYSILSQHLCWDRILFLLNGRMSIRDCGSEAKQSEAIGKEQKHVYFIKTMAGGECINKHRNKNVISRIRK